MIPDLRAMSKNTRVVAAGLLMATMMNIRILGYLRDVIIYARFGQNRITDAYNAAFSILIFIYAVGGGPKLFFYPCIFQLYHTGKKRKAEVAVCAHCDYGFISGGNCYRIYLYARTDFDFGAGLQSPSHGFNYFLTRIMFLQVVLCHCQDFHGNIKFLSAFYRPCHWFGII